MVWSWWCGHGGVVVVVVMSEWCGCGGMVVVMVVMAECKKSEEASETALESHSGHQRDFMKCGRRGIFS